MNKNIKEFTIGVFASLAASLIWTYFTIAIKNNFNVNYSLFIELLETNKVLLYWLSSFIILILLRTLSRKYIDNLQEPYPMIYSFPTHHDFQGEVTSNGLLWTFKGQIDSKHSTRNQFSTELTDELIKITDVEGPFCPLDYRELKTKRTYWGLYKYSCPKCRFKKIKLKNSWSLECDIQDELESQQRMKNKSSN